MLDRTTRSRIAEAQRKRRYRRLLKDGGACLRVPVKDINAVIADETCTDALEIAVPTPDVHWGIELK